MWTFIVNFFKALFDSLFYVLREAWRQAGILLTNFWVWLGSLGALVVTVVERFEASVYYVIALGDALATTVWPTVIVPGTFTNLFAMLNTFLPVNEGIAMLFLLVFVISVGTVYRFIKSWIPTLS